MAYLINRICLYKRPTLNGKHVVITGGSSGIGRCVGILAAKLGANVTILARNPQRLLEAQEEIKKYIINKDVQIITKVSVDVTDYEKIKSTINDLESIVGPIYMLINCAGMAICGTIEEMTIDNIKQLIDINYLGTLYPIKAIVPLMKDRKDGKIVLCGSQLSLLGMYGYTIYSSCKFALRGLAESLYMEVKPYNISITLALPPDTDTPGFENENKTKPIETKLMSADGGLYKPEDVAKKLLDDALDNEFFSCVGFESHLVTYLCVGMSPFKSFFNVLFEASILGPIRFIVSFYIKRFEKIVKKCYLEKLETKKIK